jgi:hypothetical protein
VSGVSPLEGVSPVSGTGVGFGLLFLTISHTTSPIITRTKTITIAITIGTSSVSYLLIKKTFLRKDFFFLSGWLLSTFLWSIFLGVLWMGIAKDGGY